MKLPTRFRALALPCLLAPVLAHAADTYNAVTDQLTIARLDLTPYTTPPSYPEPLILSGVVIKPGTVIRIDGGGPFGSTDYLLAVAQGQPLQLFAPAVVSGSTTYANVTATIAGVVSVGSLTGGNNYDGTYLYIPAVQVGSQTYRHVVVTVASVDGVADGLPTTTMDTYTSSSNSLTIAAVEYRGRAYTNVTATVDKVVSLAGSAKVPGPDSSACYNPAYYATGTTMDLIYSDRELQSVVLAPSSFNGIANAVGIQVTSILQGQAPPVATEYYDVTSQFPVLLKLGLTAGTQTVAYVPGSQFGGALGYGQSLQTYGVTETSFGNGEYMTDYIFEGFQDITVPAGTFKGACAWRLDSYGGTNVSSTYLYMSRQGVLLNDLQPGSTFNGAPVAQ